MGVLVVGGTANPPPFAPTLISPANGSYLDLSQTPTFVWQANPSQPGLVQSAWEFYVLENGSGSPQYWNVSTSSFQSSSVFNAGSIQSYTFPAGAFTDGNVYQWTVATKDANGTSTPAAFFTVNAQGLPTVAVVTPSGTVTSSDPMVTWAASFPAGAAQTSYRVVIYDNAQYLASDFILGESPSVYDSGQVGSAYATSLDLSAIPFYLANQTQFRCYVQVTETGGQFSSWAYSSFTVTYDAPAVPSVSALASTDPVTGCPLIALSAQGYDNLLSAADASFEAGIGSWGNGANGTVAQTSDVALDGTHSLLCTFTTGSQQRVLESPVNPCLPSADYIGMGFWRAITAPRDMLILVEQFDANKNYIGIASVSPTITDNTTGWTQAFTAPFTTAANAAFLRIQAGVASNDAPNDEEHALDCCGIFPASPFVGGVSAHALSTTGATPLGSASVSASTPLWTAGGFVGLTELVLLRSDGAYVRNASLAHPASLPELTQFLVVDDYEAIPTVDYTYQAQMMVTFGPNQTVLSAPFTSNSVLLTTTNWWELNPLDPPSAVNAQPTQWNPQNTEQSTAHMVTGQQTTNIVANVMMHQDFTGTFELFTAPIYAAFEALLKGQATVFISSPWGPTDSGYFRIGPQPGGMSTGYGNKAKDTQLLASTAAAPHRTVQITAVAQAAPPV